MCSSRDDPGWRDDPGRRWDSARRDDHAREGTGNAQMAPAMDRLWLLERIEEQGDGNLLKGWRRVFDREGMTEVGFPDFCKAAKRMGLANVRELFGPDDLPRLLLLEDLAPVEGALLSRFRTWGKETFGGPTAMFADFDVDDEGQIDAVAFHAGCARHVFVGSEDEVEDLFGCCDFANTGLVRLEELLFLEADRKVREAALFKTRAARDAGPNLKDMAAAYAVDASRGLPPTHRLAQRPWLAEHFELVPTLARQRRIEWEKQIYDRSVDAQIVFLGHIRSIYGNEVRAWRRGLDPQCTWRISNTALRRYCRQLDLPVDIAALWRALDKDADGIIRLEELAALPAMVLACFGHWAKRAASSCVALWDTPQALLVRANPETKGIKWPSDKKMLYSDFTQLLELLGWPDEASVGGPEASPASTRAMLCASLDCYGCGFITRDDLVWLSSWEPPDWLYSEPDISAWAELRNLMLQEYAHPLKAWRMLMDTDNSNQVSWEEFKTACSQMQWSGNMGGAWRALDTDLSGTISMQEFDPQSAELLQSFKGWAEDTFGSVVLAFKAFDEDGNGLLSHKELKLACGKMRWDGDTRLLFDCLDLGGKREGGRHVVAIKDIRFLDSWSSDPGSKQAAEHETVEKHLIRERSQTCGLSRACTAPSRLPSLPQHRHEQYGLLDSKPTSLDRTSRPGSGFLPSEQGRRARPYTASSQVTTGSMMSSLTAYTQSPSTAVYAERLHQAYRCPRESAKPLPRLRGRRAESWFSRIVDEPEAVVVKQPRKGARAHRKGAPDRGRVVTAGGPHSPGKARRAPPSPLFTIIDGL